MNIEATKLEIIKAINDLKSETILNQFLVYLKKYKAISVQEDLLAYAKIPTPNQISLNNLKKEQGYSIKKMNQHYASLNRKIWQGENISELLQEL